MSLIAPAFIKAKKQFSPALKDRTNPAFKSKYADLGACLDAVDDALLANGIAVMHETSEDSTGVTVEAVLLHESGETIRGGKLHVPASKQDPQGYGSALTYARRYSLMAVCGIAPEDDDGNAASAPTKKQQAPKQAPVTTEYIQTWVSALGQCKDMPTLQATFADAWKHTAHAPAVKAEYDRIKVKLIDGAAE